MEKIGFIQKGAQVSNAELDDMMRQHVDPYRSTYSTTPVRGAGRWPPAASDCRSIRSRAPGRWTSRQLAVPVWLLQLTVAPRACLPNGKALTSDD
jgi:hypothetical protein